MKSEFRTYLERTRKVNGEKYLPKTITLYCKYVEKYQEEWDKKKNIIDIINHMNDIIKESRNPYIRASFRSYLLFLGLDDEDKRLDLLKSTKKRASAINSARMLGEKSIPEQDMKLLIESVEPEWKLIIKVLYETAMREDEFLNIKMKDVMFSDSGSLGAEIRILGKGKKFRHVFLSMETAGLLKEKVAGMKSNDRIFVFRMQDGKPYKRQDKALFDGIKKRTKRFIGRAYSPHCLRHSGLQKYANEGSDIMGISSLAGHMNLSTTQVYVKASKVMAKNMVEKSMGGA